MKRILILYRELAGYFTECLNHLCETYDVEAVLVAYPVNTDAPFQLKLSHRIQLYKRSELSLEQLIKLTKDESFRLIICGGWSDKEYLLALKQRQCSALLGFDNQWNGSIKHIVSALYGRLRIRPLFEYAFVPGKKQFQFAQHLGFVESQIISGAYSCDVQRFSSLYELRKNRTRNGNRKLIFAGRYAKEKFLQELCELMQEMFDDGLTGWELHCIGTGSLWDERIEGTGIHHHGFMQPAELFEFMKSCDAFVLPSTFEPWGVVVHEFAAAGFPLILSSQVGSSEIFLKPGVNGYSFISGDSEDLRKKLKMLFKHTEEELIKMEEKSAELALLITPDTWAKSLYKIM